VVVVVVVVVVDVSVAVVGKKGARDSAAGSKHN